MKLIDDLSQADDLKALSQRAQQLLGENRPADAEAIVRRIIEKDPKHFRGHHLLGLVLGAQRQLEAAVGAFKQAIAVAPQNWDSHYNLAFMLAALGRPQEALAPVRAALSIARPCPLPVHHLHVRLLIELKDWENALAAADDGLASYAFDGKLVSLRGCVRRTQGFPADSLVAQEQLLRMQPANLPALCEKGWALLDLGQPESAMEVFDQALESDDPQPIALVGMGIAQLRCNMNEAALAALDEGLVHNPLSFDGHFFRAVALQNLERFDEARQAYSELLQRWPDCAEAYANLALVERIEGNLNEAERAQRQSLEARIDQPVSFGNLCSLLLYKADQTPESVARVHAEWDERFGHPANRFTDWPNDRDPDRALRIGFVSAELYQHPVSDLLIPALKALDPDQFRTYCYASQTKKDAVTAQIETLVPVFRYVGLVDDDALAEQIRSDAIDILIELTGHFRNNRLPVLARRPVPVQASWLGYASSTGLSSIDYAIMDAVLVRPGEDQWFSETVIRLPGGRICFEPPKDAGGVVPSPAVTNGFITFGSFNSISKTSDEVIDTWSGILRRLPSARLLLKSKALGSSRVADGLRRKFVERGVESERLELRGVSPKSEMFLEYGDMDIALDPYPFGGGLTSCNTLWMGVPLVTLPSWQSVSRQSESFLRAIDRPEWIARDVADYCNIAVGLAEDPLRLAEMRSAQREKMRASPLCDRERHGRELAEALRHMWRTFVS